MPKKHQPRVLRRATMCQLTLLGCTVLGRRASSDRRQGSAFEGADIFLVCAFRLKVSHCLEHCKEGLKARAGIVAIDGHEGASTLITETGK